MATVQYINLGCRDRPGFCGVSPSDRTAHWYVERPSRSDPQSQQSTEISADAGELACTPTSGHGAQAEAAGAGDKVEDQRSFCTIQTSKLLSDKTTTTRSFVRKVLGNGWDKTVCQFKKTVVKQTQPVHSH